MRIVKGRSRVRRMVRGTPVPLGQAVLTPEFDGQRIQKLPLRTTVTSRKKLVEEFEAKFFDDGVGEDVFGDAFDLGLSFFAAQAIEGEDEEFTLADALYLCVAERGKGAMDGLSLRIEDGGLEHDPNMSFHPRNYTSPPDFAAA